MASSDPNGSANRDRRPTRITRGYSEVNLPTTSKISISIQDNSNPSQASDMPRGFLDPPPRAQQPLEHLAEKWDDRRGSLSHYPPSLTISRIHNVSYNLRVGAQATPSHSSPISSSNMVNNMTVGNKNHQKYESPPCFSCSICRVCCNHEFAYQQHLNGKKHQKRVAQLGNHSMGDSGGGMGDGGMLHSDPMHAVLPNGFVKTCPVLADKAASTEKNKSSSPLPEEPLGHFPSDTTGHDDNESEEEGEIDEEKEDIEHLYNDFQEPISNQVNARSHLEEEFLEESNVETTVDSDIDEMFGEDNDENENDDGMPSSEVSKSSTAQFREDRGANRSDQLLSLVKNGYITNEEVSISLDKNDDDEQDMFGESSGDEENSNQACDDDKKGDAFASEKDSTLMEAKSDQNRVHDPSFSRSLQANQDDDVIDMFGSADEDENDNNTLQSSPSNHPAFSRNESAPSVPSTASEALAAARRRASIPKVPKRDTGNSNQKSLLQQMSVTSMVPLANKQGSHTGIPKRSFYPPVHPDKFWSTLRGWDFISDLNDSMKKNAQLSKKNDENKSGRGKKRPFDDVGAEEKPSRSLPDSFDSVAQYKALWAPLLIDEAKAQLISEVVSAQSSPATAWVNRSQLVVGIAVKVELSRSTKDLSIDCRTGSTTASFEPTVVLHLRSIARGHGTGCPVCPNDLLLFVREANIVELALLGRLFNGIDECATKSSALSIGKFSKGRLGFIGQALNHRSRSVDGLLVRASQQMWSQFSSLDEMFVIRIGSNVTALREFNALSRIDEVPLSKYLLDGKTNSSKEEHEPYAMENGTNVAKFDPLSQSGLPVGFRIYVKSKMNASQLQAITASSREYGCGGFTLIKGPPGTGKSTTLVSVLNALHLRQYQEYYSAIERIITESDASTYYEELALLNKANEVKPRILVCAPSNAAVDNVVVKIMSDRFVDGNGSKYCPSIIRVGTGIVNDTAKKVSLKGAVDSIILQGADPIKLDSYIENGRKELKRILGEIKKLTTRIQALVDACPYDICEDWEVRILEDPSEDFRVLFVNHKTKTTTFDIPPKVRPTEKPCCIKKLPHFIELLKSLTKYVERHNNESSTLEKYLILQNHAKTKRDRGGVDESSLSLLQDLETHLLNSTHIVLTTLGSAGSRAVESANKFEVIVIDEAAQCSEMSTLVALQLGSSHAILVGDPQQLPATVFSISGRSTKYDRSLFQRLEQCSHPVVMLNTQYRMHPMISEFPRHIFYEGMLVDGPNVQTSNFGGKLILIAKNFPHFKPLTVLDLDSREEREGTGLSNIHEARLVLHLYITLDRKCDGLLGESRVAIITPYAQQTLVLHRLFGDTFGSSYLERVEISTVDAFQGREAGIVIYSCVRAGGKGSGIGFLSDVQRMNVALTRAKYFLFIIARRRSIMVNVYWRKLIGFARERRSLIHVPIDRCNTDDPFPHLSKLSPADGEYSSESDYSA